MSNPPPSRRNVPDGFLLYLDDVTCNDYERFAARWATDEPRSVDRLLVSWISIDENRDSMIHRLFNCSFRLREERVFTLACTL